MKVISFHQFLILFIAVLYLNPNQALSQTNISKGDTIRIGILNARDKFDGILEDIKNDTLILLHNNQHLQVQVDKINSFEIARSRKSNTGKGLKIGALIGGLGLGLVAVISVSSEQGGWFTLSPGAAFAAGLGSGGLLGGLIGAIIGSAKTTCWQEANLNDIIYGNKVLNVYNSNGNFSANPIIDKSFKNAKPNKTNQNKEKALSTTQTSKKTIADSELDQILNINTSKKKWRIDLTLGTTSRGPAETLEKAMIKDGFDETSSGGFFDGPKEHPKSITGFGEIGFPWTLQVTRYMSKYFDLGIILGNAPIGETIGYHKNPSQYLTIEYSSFLISPIIFLKISPIFQLGVGPSITWNKVHETVTSSESKAKAGALFLCRIIYPRNTLFYVKFDFEYRLVQKVHFGSLSGSDHPNFSLNPFEANFSHTFIGIGIGIHV